MKTEIASRRIPKIEFSEEQFERVRNLSRSLGVSDPRALLDSAIQALEVMARTAGDGKEVRVSDPAGVRSVTVKVKK